MVFLWNFRVVALSYAFAEQVLYRGQFFADV